MEKSHIILGIIAIIIITLLISYSIFVLIPQYKLSIEQKAFNQGNLYGVQQTILYINQNSVVPVITNATSLAFENVPIKTICEGLQLQ